MIVKLPFGRSQIEVELPEHATVLLPATTTAIQDAEAAVLQSLRSPTAGPSLRERARPGQSAVIVISDITRPVPNKQLLPPVIAELEAAGIRQEDIVILNGTGLHRPNTDDELEFMLGPLAHRYRVVQHEARRRDTLVEVGRSRGVPVELNRAYVDADFRIVTGFVEPHLFAGYSGGAKGIMPGIAGAEIVMSNHGATNLAHPSARWCVTASNPVFEEMQQVAAMCPPHFLLNVTLDTEKRLTGVFSGDLGPAHEAAIEFAANQYRVPVGRPYDVVVVTNMGYPADTTLYQAVKGMSVAAEAVRQGGDIVLVAGCEEGIGSPEYVDFLTSGESPAALLEDILQSERPRHDQWQVQCQAMIQRRATVRIHSLLSDADARKAHLRPAADLTKTVASLVENTRGEGRDGSVLVLPYGQLTVPVVS